MGKLMYDRQTSIDIEDRTLMHLQQVFNDKLRRGEGFMFSWRHDPSTGEGRSSIWVNAYSALEFKYHGSRRASTNRSWLEALAFTANSPSGLHIVPEPQSAVD